MNRGKTTTLNEKEFICSVPGHCQSVLDGEYDIPLTQAPRTVLDIGANEGAFTFWARQKWPQATIRAFEPIPVNARFFRKNHGKDKAVSFSQKAVSVNRVLDFSEGLHNSGECSCHNLGEQTEKRWKVECENPAGLGQADFVKIDTEGCELEIVQGLDLTKTNALACEIHRESDLNPIIAICRKAGLDLIIENPIGIDRWILKFRRPEQAPNDAKDITRRNLFVAMPVYRTMDSLTVQSVVGLVAAQLSKREFSMKMKMHVGECPIGRARNDLTHEFLKTESTHILFIDADIVFSYEQVRRILEHDEDIVGGFYPKKQEGKASLVCNTLGAVSAPRQDGLVEMKYMGTGFLMVSRRVFEVMRQKIGDQIAYTDDRDHKTIKYDFWRMGVAIDTNTGTKRWLSEDWQFCQFALDCGFKVWADANILVRHSGMALYPLQTQLPELLLPRSQMISEHAGQTASDTAGVAAVSPPPAAPA